MLQPASESALARVRRIYGKPALLSGAFAYGLYALVQIDRFDGSFSRTALSVVAGVIPCALIGCLLALALVPLTLIRAAQARGPRGIAMKMLTVSAIVGIVAALVVVFDHVGRAA